MCTDGMDNDPAPVPENLVLQENDRQITSWNDHRGRLTFRTLFSADSTATECFVTGVAELPEDGFLALHRHMQAETYYLLSGEGVVTLGGTDYRVHPGSSVFIPGSREHGIRNTGTLTLRFFYVLAADAFTDIEYVFS
jgi:mannose-6-phosphate isomerase-like protein (cupin superfamily)